MTNPSVKTKEYLDEVQGVLREMTAYLKTLALYPENHPSQGPALERTYQRLEGLLKRGNPIDLGVAEKELILLGEDGQEHRMVSELAEKLHELGILTLKFHPHIRQDEVAHFMKALSQPEKHIDAAEPFDQTLRESGITKITATLIDYRRIIENESGGGTTQREGDFWSTLIKRAHDGDGDALKEMAGSLHDPEQIEAMNHQVKRLFGSLPKEESQAGETEALSMVHQKIFESLSSVDQQKFSKNLARLVLSDHEGSSNTVKEEVGALTHYPDEMLLQVLAGALVLQENVDSRITTTFRDLLQNNERKESLLNAAETHSKNKDFAGYPPDVWDRICSLFLSGSEDAFMSSEYHQVLQDLNTYQLEEIQEVIDEETLREVQEAFDPEHLRKIREEMIFEILIVEDRDEPIHSHIQELASHLKAYGRDRNSQKILVLLKRLLSPESPLTPRKKEKVEEIIFQGCDGAWIAPLLQEIANMRKEELVFLKEILGFCKRGLPEILVHYLGEDRSISGRKRLSALLVEYGHEAVPAVMASLNDERWYLVRNLVMILGKIGDFSCLEDLISLLSHDHFRVRREVLLTLSMIGDDRAVAHIRRMLLNRHKQEEPGLQKAAALALKRMETLKSRKVLKEGLEDKDKKVQEICCQVLKGLI